MFQGIDWAAFFVWLYNWQTLIAGIAAVIAAGFTIAATIASANREVAAAQSQIAANAFIERRRTARESWAFHKMMEAAIKSLLVDVGNVEATDLPSDIGLGIDAFKARSGLKRAGFAEVMSACIKHGGTLTAEFVQLDSDITHYASKMQLVAGTTPVPMQVGIRDNVTRELADIKQSAERLLSEAEAETSLVANFLAQTEERARRLEGER